MLSRYYNEPPPAHVSERRAARHSRLIGLGYANYSAYLRSEHWRELRKRYCRSSLPQDCVCGETETHLHHMTYERVGAEWLSDLTPLCRRCHALVHVLEWRGEIGLDLEGFALDEERARAGREWLAAEVAERQAEIAERVRAHQEAVLAMPFARRLVVAAQLAKRRHIDVSGDLHVIRCCCARGQHGPHLTTRLRKLEQTVYGWDGWADWK